MFEQNPLEVMFANVQTSYRLNPKENNKQASVSLRIHLRVLCHEKTF